MPQPSADREPNYQKKLAEMLSKGQLPTTIGVHQVLIFHDNDCAQLAGGCCDCSPDIQALAESPDAARN
jgi:hypothetical protein